MCGPPGCTRYPLPRLANHRAQPKLSSSTVFNGYIKSEMILSRSLINSSWVTSIWKKVKFINNYFYVRLEVIMAMTVKNVAFLSIMSCNPAGICCCFRGTCSLQVHDTCIMRRGATGSSEMLVNFYQITWQHIPEGNSLTTGMYLLNNE